MSSEEKQKLQELIRKRGHVKASLTRLRNFAESFNIAVSDLCELEFRQEQIPEIWKKFDDIQSTIEILDVENESVQSDERGLFEANYYTTRSLFQSIIKRFTITCPESNFAHNSSVGGNPTFDRVARLPPMSLPIFDGDIQKWASFFDSFCALVHFDVGLTDVQKLYYLRSCLTGTAADVIQSLSSTGDNYNIAINQLKSRYENKTLIIQSHIRALLNLPKVNEPSSSELRHLHHIMTSHVQSLQALGEAVEYWDAWLVTILLGRLDKTTASEWIFRQSPNQLPTYYDMESFISNRCIAYEANEVTNPLDKNKSLSKHNDNKKRDYQNNRSFFASRQNIGLSCPVCNGNHRMYMCEKFKSLNVPDRYDVIRKVKGCFNCLGLLHMVNNCKSEVKCRTCGKKHHSLLHYETKDKVHIISKENASKSGNEDTEPSTSASLHTRTTKTQILLATAQLNVLDYNGKHKTCRAVLDSGSQVNFVSEGLVKQLQLPLSYDFMSVKGIGSSPSQLCPQINITVSSRVTNFIQRLQCHVLPTITDALPVNAINIHEWNLPAHISSQLADPQFHDTSPIDMLLGAEIFFDLLNEGIWNPGHNLPTFRSTKLGWIVSGRVIDSQTTGTSSFLAATTDIPYQHCVSDLLSEHPIKKRSKNQLDEEKYTYNHFMSTYRRNFEGRFVVQLPKKSIDKLGESKFMALSRFFNLERKLMKDKKLATDYHRFMQEYLDMNHMDLISEDHITQPTFFLPHHCVIKESSITTKTRVVFDASAKSSSGLSLNDVLMCGPTVQDDLFSILVRFRLHKFVLCADIEKMYRQVEVDENDCCLQLILWRFSPDQPLRTYRLRTVTYGEKPASFLATQCINILANEIESHSPNIATILRKDFYVDDLMTGENTLEECERIQVKITDVLAKAKMPLRKWCSNSSELLQKISIKSLDPLFVLEVGDQETIKSLGLLWNPNKDSFHFFVRVSPSNITLTKRCLLSDISRVFDPLGFLTPILIVGKIFIQQLWQLKITWDEPLPADFQNRWRSFYEKLQILQNLSIPRRSVINSKMNMEIHGFCDASNDAYGACVYLKSQEINGEWVSHLLCSKSRVAPLKPTSIPRLELCAAVLLIELSQSIASAFCLDVKTFRFWTDSMIVIAWIRGNPARWKTYVANRVVQILDVSHSEQWAHVRSEDNPADLISRGIEAKAIASFSLWWHGPSWLLTSSSSGHIPLDEISEDLLEIKKIKFVLIAKIEENELLKRYSTWNRLLRISAWARRFINNALICKQDRNNRKNGSLKVDELREAAHVWCKYAQVTSFEREIHSITNNIELHKGSKLRCLNPYIDSSGLLRVGGRLSWAPINNEQRHPVLLPASCIVTKLIFDYFHKKLLHCGPQALLAQVRQHYWPLNGRNIARFTVHKCITCFHAKPKSLEPKMAPLPASRVQFARPFSTTGVDFAGPILIRSGIRRVTSTKCYISVFVCFSTRAVHLELVHGLTSGDFLSALRRFMSRRGYCSHIYSDNATNFVGARKELRSYLETAAGTKGIDSTLSEDGVNWHFIPPGSPHFGGMWEAAVKSAKHHLQRIVKNSMLTAEQMNTLLTQIEACLNSRPLTPLSTDPSDFQALTPGHFLIGGPLTLPPEPDRTIEEGLNTKWIKVQRLLHLFWKRWATEYLPQLQKRGKWHASSQSLKINDLCLLREEYLSPTKWKLVRIVQLHPGPDGITRVVSVQGPNGNTFRRPIVKMCPLPIENNE